MAWRTSADVARLRARALGVTAAVSLVAGCGAPRDVRSATSRLEAGRALSAASAASGAVPLVDLVDAAEAAVGATRGPAQGSGSPVTVFGRSGSFGALADAAGEPAVTVVPVDSWDVLPGQALYFSAVDARGRVVLANEPQTDNQTRPTATTMAISVFDPSTLEYSNVLLPTSAGQTSAVALDGSGTGGADVGDIELIGGPGDQRLAVVSSSPYNGWDPIRSGVFPTFALLDDVSGVWKPSAQQFTGAQLRSSSRFGQTVCGRELPTARLRVADCGGFAEIDALPASGDLVATRYLGNPLGGQPNGGVAVLGPSGVVLASLDYPDVVVGGSRLRVHPREVDVDPTSRAGDERFLVIFDVEAGDGTPPPFVAQEFGYDAAASLIRPVSAPFTTGATLDGTPVGVETASYDHDGNLWIAEARSNTLAGGRLVRYGRDDGRLRLSGTCGVGPDGITARWGTACEPDAATDVTTHHGLVRSLTEDRLRRRMIAVTTDGTVAVVSPGASRAVLRLPLDRLVDRDRYWIGPRKGSIDEQGSALWVPIQQLQSPDVCPSGSCPPAPLDQWLVRLDLGSM